MELNKTFIDGLWSKEINVTSFVQTNITPYLGDASFLAGPTERTKHIWNLCLKALEEERQHNGVRALDNKTVSTVTSHKAGYIDRENELIVGLQTDELLKRAIKPFGGINVVSRACKENGVEVDEKVKDIFTHYRKTHNDGVFDVYTEEIRSFRSLGFLTGLPDNYARGRIIGDYRRVALYGVDYLIKDKEAQKASTPTVMTADNIRDREELQEQIRALGELKMMAETYGFDISNPATNTQEAIQWMYFAYLAAVKEQNGAAMSIGRTSTFIDIYAERDLANGTFTEEQIQEFVDHFIMKLRMVKFARIPSYNQLFSGDPVWATLEVGGIGMDGRSMVTKNDFRFLHTLENMGPAPEPNLTVLYSSALPKTFKDYASKISIKTSSVQYENDDVMKPVWGDDYSICCCVSATQTGKEMQFFGARANLGKCLLYAINGGMDEKLHEQIGPHYAPITAEYLDYDEVIARYDVMMDWLAGLYVNVLNLIQYMHDKYYYEAAEMALIDTDVRRTFATGIAGFSHVVDSLSAIKYAKVKCVRDETGLVTDYERIPPLRQR